MQEESSSKVTQLYRLANALLSCRKSGEVLEVATENIARSLGARNAILWRMQREDATLTPLST